MTSTTAGGTAPAPDKGQVVTDVVATAKTLILDDIRAGQVPESVAGFSELHDHVDANDYVSPGAIADPELFLACANEAADQVDAWLRAGRPTSQDA